MDILFFRHRRQGADDIVRLVARHDEGGNAQGLDRLGDIGPGLGQVVGHLFPGGFVFFVALVAEGGFFGVVDDREILRLFLFQDHEKGLEEAEHRRGVQTVGIGQGILDEGEVGAVGQGGAIQKEQTGLGHEHLPKGYLKRQL